MYAAEELFDKMPKVYQTDFVRNELSIWNDFFNSNIDRYCLPAIQKEQKSYKKLYTKYKCAEMYNNKKFVPKADIYYGILTHGIQSLLKMKEAGILIGCGTDAGVPFSCHGTLWREMAMYSRIGFKNDEILRCATINNARILRMEHKIGSIAINKFADIAVLTKNPLEKILYSKQKLKQNKNKYYL